MGKPLDFEEKDIGDAKHWRALFDSRVLRHWHLPEKDITLAIEKVSALESRIGRESKRQLMIRFKGATLPFAMNATNCTTIEQLYGPDPHGWVGQRITLYVTTTEMAGKTCPCIRVRPSRPKGRTGPRDAPEPTLNESASPPAEVENTSGLLSGKTLPAADPESDGR